LELSSVAFGIIDANAGESRREKCDFALANAEGSDALDAVAEDVPAVDLSTKPGIIVMP